MRNIRDTITSMKGQTVLFSIIIEVIKSFLFFNIRLLIKTVLRQCPVLLQMTGDAMTEVSRITQKRSDR